MDEGQGIFYHSDSPPSQVTRRCPVFQNITTKLETTQEKIIMMRALSTVHNPMRTTSLSPRLDNSIKMCASVSNDNT